MAGKKGNTNTIFGGFTALLNPSQRRILLAWGEVGVAARALPGLPIVGGKWLHTVAPQEVKGLEHHFLAKLSFNVLWCEALKHNFSMSH